LLRDGPAAAADERPLYFENCATWFTSGWAPLYGVVLDGRFKVIAGPQPRVFDVLADPGETKDLAEAQDDVVVRAKELLEQLATVTIEATRRDLDPQERERLLHLGYVVGESSGRRGSVVPPGWQPQHALTPEQGIANQRRFHEASQLWQQGKREEALATLLALTKEEPENGRYAEVAAALLVQSGRPAEALPLAQKAIELLETAAVRTTLVSCLVALGRRAEAIRELDLTIERFPRVLAARMTIAELLIDECRPREAVPHLEHVLAHFDGDPTVKAQATTLLDRARR
jgi:tetratricopeptide (TPR) repeat protein